MGALSLSLGSPFLPPEQLCTLPSTQLFPLSAPPAAGREYLGGAAVTVSLEEHRREVPSAALPGASAFTLPQGRGGRQPQSRPILSWVEAGQLRCTELKPRTSGRGQRGGPGGRPSRQGTCGAFLVKLRLGGDTARIQRRWCCWCFWRVSIFGPRTRRVCRRQHLFWP